MANVAPSDNVNHAPPEPCQTVPGRAIVALAAGMAAAWFAAGSTGLLAHPLQHALTWVALAVALLAAWPDNGRQFGTWAVLGVGVVFGLIFTAADSPAVNVLAIAVVLATISQVNRGLTGRVTLIAALGVFILACFRLACGSIATVWTATDGLGWLLGRLVGFLVGCPLEVGATFGGIDFLVLAGAIYAGWLVCTPPPRRRRAIGGAAAIVAGHFAYLAALAYSEKFLALLPDVVVPPKSDVSYVGLWVWSNGLRTLVPWNVPLLALLIDGAVVAAMVRVAAWLPVVEIDPKELKKQQEKEAKEDVPGSVLAREVLFRFGPALLAVAAAVSATLAVHRSDLRGKTIVAYDQGFLDWNKPEYDAKGDGLFGLLPMFVERLGGKFLRSKDLSAQDLAAADVLLLIHPNRPWPTETLERVWNFARGGGSVLLAAEPAFRHGDWASSFNDVLQPLAMEVRFDTAVARASNWEQSYEALSHPATSGINDRQNRFGFQLGSSIRTRWPARPVLVGRFGWSDPGNDAAATGGSSYNAGERLGDLVLAAEQPLGQGRVFVLGDTSPLQNESLPNAFPFVGRLLGYLAHRPASPQSLWRQFLTFTALLCLLALLIARPVAWQTALSASVLGVSLMVCTAAGYWSARVLPDGSAGEKDGANTVAYIDAAHLGAFDGDSSINRGENRGVSGLLRTLMRHGYLPLLAPDLTHERLAGAGLAVSIAPARAFSPAEREAVRQFVGNGGAFVCIVGAEEARASAPLLADFGFKMLPSPTLPHESTDEPEPLGAFQQLFGEDDSARYVRFFAGWPVASDPESGVDKWVIWSDGKNELPVVVSRSDRKGAFVVIGDTYFAANENLETLENEYPDNIRFWRWLISRVASGQNEWDPPPASPGEKAAAKDEDEGEE